LLDTNNPRDQNTDHLREVPAHKHKVSYERAFAFDYTTLANLPAFNIKPTIEYDAKPHLLRGRPIRPGSCCVRWMVSPWR
jgi:hypothetical protein